MSVTSGGLRRDSADDEHFVHRLSRLMPAGQEVTTIDGSMLIREALALMESRGYSQLPVVFGNNVVGIFSYRSLWRAIQRWPTVFLEQEVHLALQRPVFRRMADSYRDAVDVLTRDGVVLIGDESRLVGIITVADMVTFLAELVSPFDLIRECELIIRMLIMRTLGDGEFETLIRTALAERYEAAGRRLPTSIDQLQMSDYQVLLISPQHRERFKATFGNVSRIAIPHLNSLAEIRNRVVHFRARSGESGSRDASLADLETLQDLRYWLGNCKLRLEATIAE